MINLPNLDFLTNLDFLKNLGVLTYLSNLTSLGIVNLVIAAIILLIFCMWLVSKLSEARLKKTIARESDQSLFNPQFRCVVFSAGDRSCKNALAFQTTPILVSNAPALPLQGCNAEKCSCSLLRHDDRRTGFERRDMELLDKERKSVYANKRRLKDRRRASIQEFLLPKYRYFN